MMLMHALTAVLAAVQPNLPEIVVEHDDTVIDQSCRVVIPDGTIIRDENGDGVIHIEADDIIVEFVDGRAELIGAPRGTPWDELDGIGIRIDGRTGVTLRNVHSHRYRCGIYATNADGLTIESADVSDGYAQRLRSTPQAEDGADWLTPHNNDDNQWLTKYGAAIYVEDSEGVTIRDCYARRRQNGIILDTVAHSRVYDNDFSFLSGWGLAMWRSSDNVISRNAFDFCVRGYSHGVYNRGQDSAGILMFEQNNRNVFAENSATHGGDCFFGFGGREALGEFAGEDPDDAQFARR
ncbi:MAG: right-handed parallel beta-helix repeat-containing protein, partial [Planctomycetes bacterium]|nr:right-handed parallel beta-helix repeat-containing protein [Planctomycetota bacterium]